MSAVTFAMAPAASYAITPPPQTIPDSFDVDFEDITWAGAITCNPDFGEYECMPHVHEQILAKGIDITGSPNGALITRLSVGPLGSTGMMLGYLTPSSNGEYVPAKDGLSENEVLTIHFLYSLANSVEAGLATITSDQPNVSDVPATIIMKAYGSDGSIVASTEETFTGVTSGQYTPATMVVSTADSAYNISKVTLEVAAGSSLPYDGIFLQGLSFTKIDTQPVPDRPPAITVPNWSEEHPAVVGFDYEGAEVEYYIGSSTVAWDDNDGYVVPVCDPPSGTFFPVGQHAVTCTATDSAGNVGTASFVVYVKDLADSAPEEPFTPTAGVTSGRNTVYHVETNPSGIAVNSVTNMAYVAGTNGNYLSIINATSKQVVDRIRIWNNPESVTVDESSNLIYVWASGQTTVIDGATNTVLSKVSGNEQPPRNTAINSITGLRYEFESGGSSVSVTNSITGELVTNIPVGNYAVGIAIDESRNIIYVTNTSDGTISIIDGSVNTVVDTLPAGGSPHGVAVNYNTNTVYVSNWGQNTATAIDVSDIVDDLPEYMPPAPEDPPAAESPAVADNDGMALLTISSMHGSSTSSLEGYYATVSGLDDGSVLSGFTTAEFALSTANEYVVTMYDYGQYAFDFWQDTGSIDRSRTISIPDDMHLVAVYRDINEPATLPPPDTGSDDDGEEVPPPLGNTAVTINILPADSDTAGGIYEPANVTTAVGSELVWVNQDAVPHTAVSGSGPSDPAAGAIFDTSFISPGNSSSLSITEDLAGVYALFYCAIHPWMVGSIYVEPIVDEEEIDEGEPAETPSTATVFVQSLDETSNEVSGYWTTLMQDGAVVATGFTPARFTINTGQEYTMSISDYGEYVFDHWDELGTSREQVVISTSGANEEYNAIYRPAGTPPLEESPPALPAPEPEPDPEVPSDLPGQSSLMVSSYDGNTGDRIDGYYAVLTEVGDGNTITSFTPTSFVLTNGIEYTISVYDYGNYVFDHWQDTGSKERVRTVSLTSGMSVTAIYRDINSDLLVPGSEDAPEDDEVPEEMPSLPSSTGISITTTDSAGNAISGYYVTLWLDGAVVQSGFSPVEFAVDSSTSYEVAVADYGSFAFDRWDDGIDSRMRGASAGDNLVAVYQP